MGEFLKENCLIIVLTAATVLSFLWLMKRREALGWKAASAAVIAVTHTLIGVLAVKAFPFIENLGDRDSLGNMSLYGGIFFMPLYYWLVSKILRTDVRKVFDNLTVCLIVTLFCARINCIVSGCCHGKQFFSTAYEWPTRELEMLFHAALLAFFIPRIRKDEKRGQIYPLYMICYGVFRFFEEFLRYSSGGGIFHKAHLWSVLAAGIGLSVYNEMTAKKQKKQESEA